MDPDETDEIKWNVKCGYLLMHELMLAPDWLLPEMTKPSFRAKKARVDLRCQFGKHINGMSLAAGVQPAQLARRFDWPAACWPLVS